ncbi:MAG: HWE histidine kinase domain-containing protein [Pseudomonadota bacterium]|nr:HWE histidine kinase domain-containing protein [Pseudomonadota bacterium]
MRPDPTSKKPIADGTAVTEPVGRSRLDALYGTDLMDSGPEERFDRLTRLVAATLSVPVALVSLVDTKRQFFKSTYGLPEPWSSDRETPLSHSFCRHVVESASPLIIDDATSDPLVRNNLAIRDLDVRAYLGIPLVTQDGHVLGSLCAIDATPRRWTEKDQAILAEFAKLVEDQIALRERVEELARFDEQRALVQGELAHRIKNIFAVISSLLLVSSKTETDVSSFVRALTGRIQALSKANDFIIDAPSSKGGEAKGLNELFDALLSPFKRNDEQVILSCIPVSVGEKTAAGLALVIHELATNSAKYGALAAAEGRVVIKCTRGEDDLRIIWEEVGGPPIVAPPEKKGFGSKLVARTVESQLMGTIVREYLPSGLRVTLAFSIINLRH